MTNNVLHRVSRILFYSVILFLLIIYGKRNNPTITLAMCSANPVEYDNALLEIANEITIKSIHDNSIIIHQIDQEFNVVGTFDDVSVNDFIALKVIFHKEGWLELLDFKVADKRREKIWISVLPLLLVILIFYKSFKFNFKSFNFSRRN